MGFWNGVVRLASFTPPLATPGTRKDEFLFPHLEASGATLHVDCLFLVEPSYNITMACFQFCFAFLSPFDNVICTG